MNGPNSLLSEVERTRLALEKAKVEPHPIYGGPDWHRLDIAIAAHERAVGAVTQGISTVGLTDADCTVPCLECGIEAFRHHDSLGHDWQDPDA